MSSLRSIRFCTVALAVFALAACRETKVEPLPAAPRVVSFTASSTRLAVPGPVTLSWNTTGANEVTLVDAHQGAVAGTDNRDQGSVEVTVQRTTLYVLRAVNARGVTDSAALVVDVGGTVSELVFTASPDVITSGQQTTLAWSAAGARAVKITDAAGTALDLKGQVGFGTVQVQPARDAVYSLDVDGIVTTAKVTVRPDITEFSAAPPFAKAGETVKLSWKTVGGAKATVTSPIAGTLATITDAAQVAEGSVDVTIPAGATTSDVSSFRLIVEGDTAGVTSSRDLSVYVSDVPRITEFVVPRYAETGTTVRLSWKTTGEQVELSIAGQVVFQTSSVAQAQSGFIDFATPATTTEYTLTARNLRGGSATQKSSVEPVGPVSLTFTAAPLAVTQGGSPVTLTWNAPNARNVKIEARGLYALDQRTGMAAESGTYLAYPNLATTEYVVTVDNGVGAPVSASQTVTAATLATFTYSQQAVPIGAQVQVTGSTAPDGGTTVTGLPGVATNVPGDGFIDIVADGGVSIAYAGPDTTAKLVTLPEVFTTTLYGTRVSGDKLSISINGWFMFNSTTVSGPDDNVPPLPSTGLEPLAIAPYWDDLYDTAASEIYYRLDGAGPDRRLIVQWDQVEHDLYTGSTLTFQAQVYASGKVVFAYKSFVGVTVIDGSVGIVSPGEYTALMAPTPPADNTSFTFFGAQTIPFPLTVIPSPLIARQTVGTGFVELVAAPTVLQPNQFGISEVMVAPAAGVTDGEWIEVESRSATAQDLQGWTLDFGGGQTHVIASSVVIPPGGRVLLGQSATGGDGLAVDYVYPNTLQIPDTGSAVSLTLAGAAYSTFDTGALLVKPGYSLQADPVGRVGVTYLPTVTHVTCPAGGSFGTNGQRGTPKAVNGRCPPFIGASIPGAFVSLAATGTPVTLTTPTEENVVVTLPTPIEAGGARISDITVSTNGYLALKPVPCVTATNCYLTNRTSLTMASTVTGVVAPFWDNIEPNAGGGIYTQAFDPDATPNSGDEVVIVSWENFKPSVGTGALNFQTKFFADGSVEFHYGAMSSATASYAQGTSATTLLDDPLGRAAMVINQNSSTAPGIQPNSGYRFARQ